MVMSILEAAARVLARESLPGFNTNRVAEVAGVSVGSLYQYFPNKTALIAALIDRAQSGLAQAIESAVKGSEGQSLEASVHALVRVAIDQQYGRPLLAAALDHEERRLPVEPAVSAAEKRIVRSVETLLRRHRVALSRRLPAGAARDCLVIAKAMVDADASVADRPSPGLQRRVARALMGYLTFSA